ncbi:MAG: phosphatase PAP2 family protein [Ruminococcus sp.]
MNRKRYEATVRFFSENKTAYRLLWIIYRVLPYILLFSYPALIVAEFFIMGVTGTWANLIILPFAVLTAVTLLRFMIREQRPYEKYGMNSVFRKTTVGKSMPSRHTASAFIIAMTFLYVNLPLGIIAMTFAVLIGASRVLAGAHFIRDVIVGALVGIIAGLPYFLGIAVTQMKMP